jgi:hypothetical protein
MNTFAVGDKFTFSLTNNNLIHWDLGANVTETFSVNNLLTDRNGTVTGTFGGLYVSLANVPNTGSVTVLIGATPTTGWTNIPGTSIIYLASTSSLTYTNGLSISYTYPGNNPPMGSSYYITGKFARPASYYNTPQLFYDLPSAQAWLAPYTTDNDLAIAADLAFAQNNPPLAIAVVQVLSSNGSGTFGPSDIDAALAGLAEVTYATDIVPLNLYQFWSKFLAFNVAACDPFEKREHIQYFGAPIGTPVGAPQSPAPGSIVYLAQNTLKVSGRSHAHGTRILIGATQATKTATLTDGTITSITLDGSFIAAATAAFVAGLPNYSSTLLKQQLLGFDTMQTYGKTTNETLGGAGAIFFSNASSGVYVFEEDQTVDNYSAEFHEILPMRTKQDVTRIVRDDLDATLIGMVPNTRGDASRAIATQIKNVLTSLINRGVTAPYQDSDGNIRSISDSDVQVFSDSTDPTLYNFYYDFFTRFAIKRLYGLYTVNPTA